MLAISTEKVNDPLETSVVPGTEGLPLPPIACDRPPLRSASALRAYMSLREAGQAPRSETFTPLSLYFLMRLTFGLPSNAPRLMSVCSAWPRVRSPLLLCQAHFFSSRVLYKFMIRGFKISHLPVRGGLFRLPIPWS